MGGPVAPFSLPSPFTIDGSMLGVKVHRSLDADTHTSKLLKSSPAVPHATTARGLGHYSLLGLVSLDRLLPPMCNRDMGGQMAKGGPSFTCLPLTHTTFLFLLLSNS